MARFAKDLSPDYISFTRNLDLSLFPYARNYYPPALNGFGGREAYIAGIAEAIHGFLLDRIKVEECAIITHFSQFRKIEVLLALQKLEYDIKINMYEGFYEDILRKYKTEYVLYEALTAGQIASINASIKKGEEESEALRKHLEPILSAYNLERPDFYPYWMEPGITWGMPFGRTRKEKPVSVLQ